MSVKSTKTFLNDYTRLNNRRKHVQELADSLTSKLHAREMTEAAIFFALLPLTDRIQDISSDIYHLTFHQVGDLKQEGTLANDVLEDLATAEGVKLSENYEDITF